MMIEIPEIAVVLVHGRSHAGAHAFAARHFAPDEILDMSGVAAEMLLPALSQRVVAGQMTAIIEGGSPAGAHKLRVALASTAREGYVRRFGIVLPDARPAEPGIAERLKADGYREVFEIAPDVLDAVTIQRMAMPTDLRHERGPFDIIGDVHGCGDELEALLCRLGYKVQWREGERNPRVPVVTAPPGRRAIFVGDLVDRGPRSADVLGIVLAMVNAGSALLVPGNHDVKFLRWLEGGKVAITHGLEATLASLEGVSEAFRSDVRAMLKRLWSHVWLDGGRLAVAHAGILAPMLGRATPRVRRFCLYGDTTGEQDASGLPVRYHWALDYAGETAVVYGHTPVAQAEWVGNTLCLDTGCCFGGKLTALRWPEREIVAVPAVREYARLLRPFGHPPPRPKIVGL